MFWIAVAVAITSWLAGIAGALGLGGRGGNKVSIAGVVLALIVAFLLSRILRMAR